MFNMLMQFRGETMTCLIDVVMNLRDGKLCLLARHRRIQLLKASHPSESIPQYNFLPCNHVKFLLKSCCKRFSF